MKKRTIEVSHEVPKALFTASREFNNYDYMLDFCWDDKSYVDYYAKSLEEGRRVIFDNSLFEFYPEVPPMDRFYSHIKELNKNNKNLEYIVTDVLNNADDTIAHFDEWMSKYSDAPGKSIGVAQGATLEDLTRCYVYMTEHADKVAIPFDSKAFDELVEIDEFTDDLTKWSLGRPRFVEHLIRTGVYRKDIPIHLLGASYVFEFHHPVYRQAWIETVDTSNPIVCGIKHIKYEVLGNPSKPSVKLCELLDYKPTEGELEIIKFNTSVFQGLLNG